MKSLYHILLVVQCLSGTAITVAMANLTWVTISHPPFERFTHLGLTIPAGICISLNGTGVFMTAALLKILLSKFGK